jgi:hypothetical protein
MTVGLGIGDATARVTTAAWGTGAGDGVAVGAQAVNSPLSTRTAQMCGQWPIDFLAGFDDVGMVSSATSVDDGQGRFCWADYNAIPWQRLILTIACIQNVVIIPLFPS